MSYRTNTPPPSPQQPMCHGQQVSEESSPSKLPMKCYDFENNFERYNITERIYGSDKNFGEI